MPHPLIPASGRTDFDRGELAALAGDPLPDNASDEMRRGYKNGCSQRGALNQHPDVRDWHERRLLDD